jgi:transcription elongation factor Elf1
MSMVARKMYFQLLDTDFFQKALTDTFKNKASSLAYSTDSFNKEKIRNLVSASQSKFGCLECGHIDLSGAKHHELANITLCETCSSSDKYKLITATDAKKLYRLNDKELEDIDCITTRNPHYRSAAPMRLFWEKQIADISLKKHVAKNTTLEAAKLKAEESSSKRVANKAAKEDLIRKELENALSEFGLTIRGDSQLCQCYLSGRWGSITPMTAQQIALRMRTMHILHTHTRYEEKVSEEIVRERSNVGYLPRHEYMEMVNEIKEDVEASEMQRWQSELRHRVTCLCNKAD